jgi:hypothetical protein
MRIESSLLAAVLLTSCLAGTEPAGGQAVEPIVNGTDDAGRDPSVVILIGETGTTSFYACTASVVTPRIVLTAAHCVTIDAVTRYHVEFFESWDTQSDAKTGVIDRVGRDIVDKWIDPNYDPILVLEGAGHDVALALLDSPVPPALVPLPLYRSRLTRAIVGQTDRFVGFGDRDDAQPKLIKRQYATATIEGLTPQQFNFSDQPSNICEGDSGGPSFITVNGIEYIAGITSTGLAATCHGTSNMQRLDDDLPELVRYVADHDPQPTTNCGEDGVCGWSCPDIDPDCPCILDGHCDAACSALDTDPDCPTSCDADGVCQRSGCPRPDPDCGTAALGAACTTNQSCASDLCVTSGMDHVCSQTCGNGGTCPAGFACVSTTNSCLAATDDGAGGCAIEATRTDFSALFVGLALLAARRRRPRRVARA